jgi:hypothetical protein
MIGRGWDFGPTRDKGARWTPEEIGPVVDTLLAERAPPRKVWGTS